MHPIMSTHFIVIYISPCLSKYNNTHLHHLFKISFDEFMLVVVYPEGIKYTLK